VSIVIIVLTESLRVVGLGAFPRSTRHHTPWLMLVGFMELHCFSSSRFRSRREGVACGASFLNMEYILRPRDDLVDILKLVGFLQCYGFNAPRLLFVHFKPKLYTNTTYPFFTSFHLEFFVLILCFILYFGCRSTLMLI
jgi:hypothetical protein